MNIAIQTPKILSIIEFEKSYVAHSLVVSYDH